MSNWQDMIQLFTRPPCKRKRKILDILKKLNMDKINSMLHLCMSFLFKIVFELEELPILFVFDFFGWESCPALIVFVLIFFLRSSDLRPPAVPLDSEGTAKLAYFSFVVFKLLQTCRLSLSVFVWWL